jgi:hypothetical protein
MAKKDKEKVTELKAKEKPTVKELVKTSKELKEAAKPQGATPDPRANMTQEEIEEFMRREEELLFGKVDKFLALNPKPDTSSLEEEEEEETFTLDLENKVVTQKVGEGVVARDKDGTIHEVKDPNVVKMVEEAVKEVAPPQPAKPELEIKYTDMVTQRFVSRAISSLLVKLRETAFETEKTIEKGLHQTFVGGELSHQAVSAIDAKRDELKLAYSNYPRWGTVVYDKIPEWAIPYIDEYVERCINNLIDLGEQD